MNKNILLGIILILLFAMPAQASQHSGPFGDTLYFKRDLSQVTVRELQQITGKKFTLKQKIAFKLLQKKEKRFRKAADEDTQGNLSFIFALALIVIATLAIFNVLFSGFMSVLLVVAFPVLGILSLWLGLRSIKRNGKNFKNLFGTIIGGAAIILTIIIGISALTMF